MRAIHPTRDRNRCRARIAIGNAGKRKAGVAIIKDDADLLLDACFGEPAQDMAGAGAMCVVHAFTALIEEGEAIHAGAVLQPQRLAGLEVRQRL